MPKIVNSPIDNLHIFLLMLIFYFLNIIALGFNKTMVCQNLNMDIRIYEKLMNITQSERDTVFKLKE